MIRQTVLPFKLERTEEKVTARSGLVLFAELMKGMGLGSVGGSTDAETWIREGI